MMVRASCFRAASPIFIGHPFLQPLTCFAMNLPARRDWVDRRAENEPRVGRGSFAPSSWLGRLRTALREKHLSDSAVRMTGSRPLKPSVRLGALDNGILGLETHCIPGPCSGVASADIPSWQRSAMTTNEAADTADIHIWIDKNVSCRSLRPIVR